ncbi:Uncharacterised protein [Mycobacterium tuberculosis]|uniref:Uncharacterized protein n=1 Tax=Mycobacterium tuberculosis TaxID=1773 RepID=A0A654TUD8_MYCTX|nr:Uncharacterised protein [Mycobacterium tuberculosis]CFS30420.1 Uncharacterised protein [Mycobacterium tuberculosis]CKR07124.1 Uncharacterised protein [Mycobacterium tuberculosis]CKR33878.1 Uncharacterised protein [Mycobacterium tuberculosis]CNW81594.1 Uncharacterised protein [Mycobacterium tuberculosis]
MGNGTALATSAAVKGYALCTHLMPMKALRSDKILSGYCGLWA